MQEIRAFESAAVFRFYVGVVSTTDCVYRKRVNSSHLSRVGDFLSRVFCQPNSQRSVNLADHCSTSIKRPPAIKRAIFQSPDLFVS